MEIRLDISCGSTALFNFFVSRMQLFRNSKIPIAKDLCLHLQFLDILKEIVVFLSPLQAKETPASRPDPWKDRKQWQRLS